MKLNTRSILERLSEPQRRLLREYGMLLRKRAVPLGLISCGDVHRLWERHVLDSLRGVACAPRGEAVAYDVGSGAGLPGVPLAIALPRIQFSLVEPKRRRAAFLELVVETLELPNVAVLPLSANEVRTSAGLCLARALGPPSITWRVASSLLTEGGRLFYWAGRTWGHGSAAELESLGVRSEICLEGEFQWQGPLVIMTRFPPAFPNDHERA